MTNWFGEKAVQWHHSSLGMCIDHCTKRSWGQYLRQREGYWGRELELRDWTKGLSWWTVDEWNFWYQKRTSRENSDFFSSLWIIGFSLGISPGTSQYLQKGVGCILLALFKSWCSISFWMRVSGTLRFKLVYIIILINKEVKKISVKTTILKNGLAVLNKLVFSIICEMLPNDPLPSLCENFHKKTSP